MWSPVSTTMRAARKIHRVQLSELGPRIREVALLAHHALGVEGPTLSEVRGVDELADPAGRRLHRGEVPVMAGVGLVDGDRGDDVHVVGGKTLRVVGACRPRGGPRHVEVPDAAGAESRGGDVRGDGDDRAQKRRRRLDLAHLALGEADEAVVAQEAAGLPRLVLVAPAHLLEGRGAVLAHRREDGTPRRGVRLDPPGQRVHLRLEFVEGVPAPGAQIRGAAAEQLPLAQQCRVALLADGVAAPRRGGQFGEEGEETPERIGGPRCGGGDLGAGRRVGELGGQHLLEIRDRRLALTDRAADDQRARQLGGEVRPSGLERARHGAQAARRAAGQLRLGEGAVDDEAEDPVEARVEVHRRVPLPGCATTRGPVGRGARPRPRPGRSSARVRVMRRRRRASGRARSRRRTPAAKAAAERSSIASCSPSAPSAVAVTGDTSNSWASQSSS